MNLDNFDIRLLVALDALLTEKSVTRAGERLHLSQPATSIILSRLRKYFGNELLAPAGRKMILTPLAESLVQPVRSCLMQIQHTVASKASFDPAASDRMFCLAVSDYVTAVLMPHAMQEAAREAPGIRFELVRLDENIEQKLEKGGIDFFVRPSVHSLRMHPKEPLFEDTHTCVVWRNNSTIGDRISLDQFIKMGHIAVHFGTDKAIFEEWFAAQYGEIRKIEGSYTGFRSCMPACRGDQQNSDRYEPNSPALRRKPATETNSPSFCHSKSYTLPSMASLSGPGSRAYLAKALTETDGE